MVLNLKEPCGLSTLNEETREFVSVSAVLEGLLYKNVLSCCWLENLSLACVDEMHLVNDTYQIRIHD